MKKNCPRCGKPFVPERTKLKTLPWTRHCKVCRVRNMFDGMDLPTPPDLLDEYTKNPTLTGEEWRTKLRENNEH